MQTVLIAIAGIVGVLLRYFTQRGLEKVFVTAFPYGTFTINVAGSLLIGFTAIFGAEKNLIPEALRTAIMVGFLGGFTTFSTFSEETFRLLQSGEVWIAALYVSGSVLFSVLGVGLGSYFAKIF